MAADGHVHSARAQGVEHRRVRGHRVLRTIRVHALPEPAQAVPQAQEAHGRVLRHVPRIHGRVRVLVRQFVARRLGSHGHDDGHPDARSRRVRGAGHMQPGLHEDPVQHHRSPHSHTHGQLRRILRGAHAVPYRSPCEISSNLPMSMSISVSSSWMVLPPPPPYVIFLKNVFRLKPIIENRGFSNRTRLKIII